MKAVISILAYYFLTLPLRVWRLICHLLFIPSRFKVKYTSILDGILGLMISVLDVAGVLDVFQVLTTLWGLKTSHLSKERYYLVNQWLGEVIDDRFMLLKTNEKVFTKNYAHAYVTGNVINFNEEISDATFIHECIHVAQYQQYGGVYIYFALKAQAAADTYDYGGYFGLAKSMNLKVPYVQFNMEQQAQIIEDYFEIRQRPDLMMNTALVKVYDYYYREMLSIYRKNNLIKLI